MDRSNSKKELQDFKGAEQDRKKFDELTKYFKSYIKRITKIAKANWKPPIKERGTSIIARCTLNKKGEISNIKIIKSSSIIQNDESAIDALKKSSPLPPLPTEYQGSSIDIEFHFDMKSFWDDEPYELYEKTFQAGMHNEIKTDLTRNKIYKYIGQEQSSAQCYKPDGTVDIIDTMQIFTAYDHKLKPFIKTYIKAFKENKLTHAEKKYYSFDEHIQLFFKLILEPAQKENRKSFTLNYNFDEIDFSLAKEILQKDFELKKFRLYELLLFLEDKKYIKINKKMKFIELKNVSALEDEFKKGEYILSINITLEKEWYKILKLLPNNSKPEEKQLKITLKPEDVKNSKNVDICLDGKPISLSYPEYEFLFNVVVKEKEFYSSDVDNHRMVFNINEKIRGELENPFWNLLTDIPVHLDGKHKYALRNIGQAVYLISLTKI